MFKRFYNAFLSSLMVMLGFESCNNLIDAPSEYGTPHVDYKVIGTVTDTAGNPIPGIKVSVKHQYGKELSDTVDSVYTDAKGAYETKVLSSVFVGDRHTLVFEDVDGPKNGSFASDTVNISRLNKQQVKKGSGWDQGFYNVDGSITLKPAE